MYKQHAPNFIYFHGGPGLHSFAEESQLTPFFEKHNYQIHFWNDLSAGRPQKYAFFKENAYQNSLNWAGEFLHQSIGLSQKAHLIAHSFAANIVLSLATKLPHLIQSITLITPGLDIPSADMRILNLSVQDFKNQLSPLAQKLEDLIPKIGPHFDQNKLEAFQLVLQNSHLFNHYWSDIKKKDLYFSFFQNPGHEFDSEVLFSIRQSMQPIENLWSNIPTLVIFGEKDPIILPHHEISFVEKFFPNCQIKTLPNLCHYPHIESTEEFLGILFNFVQENSR